MDVEALRKRIDELDARIVALLNERAECARQIGVLKRNSNLPIYEPEREKVIFENVQRNNPGPLPGHDLVQVYERIIDVMRKVQREQIDPPAPVEHGSEIEEND